MDTCIKFKVGLVVSLIEKSIALVIYFSYCNKNCNITSTKQLYLSQRDGVSSAFFLGDNICHPPPTSPSFWKMILRACNILKLYTAPAKLIDNWPWTFAIGHVYIYTHYGGWMKKKILKISHALVTTCWLFFIYSDYFQYSSNYFIKPEQNHILFYIKFDNDISLLVLTNLLSEAVRNKKLSRWAFWK